MRIFPLTSAIWQIFNVQNDGPNAYITLGGGDITFSGGGGGGGGRRADEEQIVWRIQNFIQKRGGIVSSDDLWSVLGTDDVLAPFLKRRGGTGNFLKMYPQVCKYSLACVRFQPVCIVRCACAPVCQIGFGRRS